MAVPAQMRALHDDRLAWPALADTTERAFEAVIEHKAFPGLGAKASQARGGLQFMCVHDLVSTRGGMHAHHVEPLAADGSANPMLAVHGKRSEARQYSGREVDGYRVCPFHAATGKAPR